MMPVRWIISPQKNIRLRYDRFFYQGETQFDDFEVAKKFAIEEIGRQIEVLRRYVEFLRKSSSKDFTDKEIK